MYGYIYKTINIITNQIYIGKKKSDKFLSTYYGSGKNIKNQLKIYGKKNFKVILLDIAENKEELNKLEKMYIKNYKRSYRDICLNLAKGGDGGSVYEYADDETKDNFSSKMQKINSSRCSSDEYRNECSIRMKNRYTDHKERENNLYELEVLGIIKNLKIVRVKYLKNTIKLIQKIILIIIKNVKY